MPDKEKRSEFTVTDRRLFSSEGELRPDVVEAEERRQEREQEQHEAQKRANEERASRTASPAKDDRSAHIHAIGAEAPTSSPPGGESDYAEPPTAAERLASAEAYNESNREMDAEIRKELGKQGQAHRAHEFEMNFEKFLASLYMSALMQLGMAAPQGGEPHVDLIGARQSIDIIGILQEKTKGNLTAKEETMLQNVLYELRMAYIEVTNLIAQAPPPGKGANSQKQ